MRPTVLSPEAIDGDLYDEAGEHQAQRRQVGEGPVMHLRELRRDQRRSERAETYDRIQRSRHATMSERILPYAACSIPIFASGLSVKDAT